MPRRLRRRLFSQAAFLTMIAMAALAARATAQSVSYSRQVAPILAMNCHACHGANPESKAGGLSTRTWADLEEGGNLGSAIVPGNPGRSALLQFVNGARGEAHRMPLGGPPLSAGQIELIRRWIAEGSAEDTGAAGKYRLELPAVAFDGSKAIRFFFKLPTTGYVELELADSRGRILYMDGGAVKDARDAAAIGVPGEWIAWNLRRASDWPVHVRARLTIAYAAAEPENAIFTAAQDADGVGPEFPAGEAEVRIVSAADERIVFRGREHVRSGVPARGGWSGGLDPGLYVLHLRYERPRHELAVFVRAAARAQ